MSNQLEQFIRDNREAFDSEEPSPRIWENIQHPPKEKEEGKTEVRVIRFGFLGWAAAACLLVLLGGSIWYFNRPKSNNLPEVAVNRHQATDSPSKATPQEAGSPSNEGLAKQDAATGSGNEQDAQLSEPDKLFGEEMAHYASLVEIKHKQLKAIEKDEPLLYRQFASDVNKLDSVYNHLKKQLPNNPNREQLLEAMIQNLQLQMQLLNHQLEIVKQINHSKKQAYEKAYKSI